MFFDGLPVAGWCGVDGCGFEDGRGDVRAHLDTFGEAVEVEVDSRSSPAGLAHLPRSLGFIG